MLGLTQSGVVLIGLLALPSIVVDLDCDPHYITVTLPQVLKFTHKTFRACRLLYLSVQSQHSHSLCHVCIYFSLACSIDPGILSAVHAAAYCACMHVSRLCNMCCAARFITAPCSPCPNCMWTPHPPKLTVEQLLAVTLGTVTTTTHHPLNPTLCSNHCGSSMSHMSSRRHKRVDSVYSPCTAAHHGMWCLCGLHVCRRRLPG
jgi:hypothetical protein